MKVHETKSVGLLALKMDGTPDVGARRPCGVCGKDMVLFQATPGLQAATGLPRQEVVCCNTKWKLGLPCPGALHAKKFLDALAQVASR